MRKLFLLWTLLFMALPPALATTGSAAAGVDAANADSPRELVIETSNQLLKLLQKNHDAIKKDPQVAYRLADETVIPHLDFNAIARWVLGRYWRSADAGQRSRFTEEFRKFLTHTYVTAMVTYTDRILANANNVSYPPLRMDPGSNDATVRSVIKLENGGAVSVDYRMHRADGTWKIYDLTIEGVSLALTYRNSLSNEIQQVGLDGVIAKLADRNATAR